MRVTIFTSGRKFRPVVIFMYSYRLLCTLGIGYLGSGCMSLEVTFKATTETSLQLVSMLLYLIARTVTVPMFSVMNFRFQHSYNIIGHSGNFRAARLPG